MGVFKLGSHKGLQFAILLFLFFNTQTVQAQTPIFLGENLVFYVSDSLCVMRGEYHFLNPSDEAVKTRLFYPFPAKEQLPFPDMIAVRSIETGENLAIMRAEKACLLCSILTPFRKLIFMWNTGRQLKIISLNTSYLQPGHGIDLWSGRIMKSTYQTTSNWNIAHWI